MLTPVDDVSSKIVGKELAAFAQQTGEEERSVIVELSTTKPVKLTPKRRSLPRHGTWTRESAPPASRDAKATRAAMDALEGVLKQFVREQALVRLETAQAFVLSVTPEQLRKVIGESLVGWVRPNRTHGVPPKRGRRP
jgi:hypothetical protein